MIAFPTPRYGARGATSNFVFVDATTRASQQVAGNNRSGITQDIVNTGGARVSRYV
jgi:hypothetical protein